MLTSFKEFKICIEQKIPFYIVSYYQYSKRQNRGLERILYIVWSKNFLCLTALELGHWLSLSLDSNWNTALLNLQLADCRSDLPKPTYYYMSVLYSIGWLCLSGETWVVDHLFSLEKKKKCRRLKWGWNPSPHHGLQCLCDSLTSAFSPLTLISSFFLWFISLLPHWLPCCQTSQEEIWRTLKAYDKWKKPV